MSATAEQRAEWQAKYNAPCVLVDSDGPEWVHTLVIEGVEVCSVRAPIRQVWTADRHRFKNGVCKVCGEPQPRPPRYSPPWERDWRRR